MKALRSLLNRLGSLFPRNPDSDSVATTLRFDAPPDAVWRGIRFYEDVPGRAPLVLRLFVPAPVRTQGNKMEAGSRILCTYDGGDLVKRMTAVEPPSSLRFEVLEQRLGIESLLSTARGSYEIRAAGAGSEVVLTTHYCGHLRPRWLWRPFERFLAHRLHRHILHGMRALLARLPAERDAPVPAALVAEAS